MSLYVDIEKKLNRFTLKSKFETESGVLALLGASGSGKSMTLKCIAGIEKPDRGLIILDGKVLFDSEKHINLPPQKRHVGYLFQQYALFPNMNVRDNIRCGLRDKKNAGDAISRIITAMGLEGLEKQSPARLSGGQQQRVALARIMVNEPEVLLLDEPFSALDSYLRFKIETEVRELLKSFNKPVLLVSHDKDEVFRLSDRIALMDNGRIKAIGEKAEVFSAPSTEKGAILTGCRNISKIEKLGERKLYAKDWKITLETGFDIGNSSSVGLRKEDLSLEGDENPVECEVAEVIENPFSSILMLRPCPDAEPLIYEVRCQAGHFKAKDKVTIFIKKDAVLLLGPDEEE